MDSSYPRNEAPNAVFLLISTQGLGLEQPAGQPKRFFGGREAITSLFVLLSYSESSAGCSKQPQGAFKFTCSPRTAARIYPQPAPLAVR